MKTLEWKFERFKDLPPGEWRNEPDKKQWMDKETQMPCLIVRNYRGALCGYVGVNKEHAFFNKEFYGMIDSDHEQYDAEETLLVHGGITFTGKCQNNKEGICHIVEENEDDNIWWLGFDCNHCDDLAPIDGSDYLNRFYNKPVYRNITYVENEIRNLAKQLKEIKQ